MPPKSQRFNRSEFASHFKTGVRYHTTHFTFIITPGEAVKYGVVVSKKVAKKAHDRNRIRRRIYTLLRTHLPTTVRCIVVVKPSLARLTRRQLQEIVLKEIAEVVVSR